MQEQLTEELLCGPPLPKIFTETITNWWLTQDYIRLAQQIHFPPSCSPNPSGEEIARFGKYYRTMASTYQETFVKIAPIFRLEHLVVCIHIFYKMHAYIFVI